MSTNNPEVVASELGRMLEDAQDEYDPGEDAQGAYDPVEGDPVEGDPIEGDPIEGDPVEGDPVEGDPIEGVPVEGDARPEEVRDEVAPSGAPAQLADTASSKEELGHAALCATCVEAQEREHATLRGPKACSGCGDELPQSVVVHGSVDSALVDPVQPGLLQRAREAFITGPRYERINVELYGEWGNWFRRWRLEHKLAALADKQLGPGRDVNIRVQRELFDDGDEPMRYTWWEERIDSKELTIVLSDHRRGGETPRTRDEIIGNFLAATDDVRRWERAAERKRESSDAEEGADASAGESDEG